MNGSRSTSTDTLRYFKELDCSLDQHLIIEIAKIKAGNPSFVTWLTQ